MSGVPLKIGHIGISIVALVEPFPCFECQTGRLQKGLIVALKDIEAQGFVAAFPRSKHTRSNSHVKSAAFTTDAADTSMTENNRLRYAIAEFSMR